MDLEKNFNKKLDIKILPRTVNNCKVVYTIERKKDASNGVYKTEIRPSLLCKGLGLIVAKHLEENQPYKDLRDIISKTNSSIVDRRAIDALASNGYLGGKKGIKNRDKIVEEFIKIRDDLKLSGRKGVESKNIFE